MKFCLKCVKIVIYLNNIIIPIPNLCEENVHKYPCTRSSRLVEYYLTYILRQLQN